MAGLVEECLNEVSIEVSESDDVETPHFSSSTPFENTTIASLHTIEQYNATSSQIEARINFLKEFKDKIEGLSVFHQIEVLRIFEKNGIKLNENKNGVFVNITYISNDIINEITKYLGYVVTQESQLNEIEQQKATICKEFFQ
jgi:hypothetical protein